MRDHQKEAQEITFKVFNILEKRLDVLCADLSPAHGFSVRMSICASLMASMIRTHVVADGYDEVIEQTCNFLKKNKPDIVSMVAPEDSPLE